MYDEEPVEYPKVNRILSNTDTNNSTQRNMAKTSRTHVSFNQTTFYESDFHKTSNTFRNPLMNRLNSQKKSTPNILPSFRNSLTKSNETFSQINSPKSLTKNPLSGMNQERKKNDNFFSRLKNKEMTDFDKKKFKGAIGEVFLQEHKSCFQKQLRECNTGYLKKDPNFLNDNEDINHYTIGKFNDYNRSVKA